MTPESAVDEGAASDSPFAEEVARVRDSGAFGESGRLRELFDFLAARGLASQPASQAEIAEDVFGQVDSDGDDATVRVYVHRLRKRLDQFYDGDVAVAAHGRLTIPGGTYALRLITPGESGPVSSPRRMMRQTWLLVAALVLLTAVAFAAGRMLVGNVDKHPINAIWRPFVESDRPILVVVGDYYMFGEIDPLAPENGRLIRDFRVNSPADLVRAQVEEPARYGISEDVGLTYLPLSSADALRALMPVLAHHDKPVQMVPASKLDSRMLSEFNVVYVGLVSGMGLLEDVTFMGSNLAVGETYDELVHLPSNGHFVSGEAQSLPLPGYYTDYGYLSVFRAPGGGLVAVVAGARDTALRAIAPLVVREDLPEQIERLADNEEAAPYEALFEITGQQGADLNDRLVFAAPRPER
jgi:hypothetical protein